MSLNFLKWQEGVVNWKQDLGLALLLLVVSLILIWREGRREGKLLAFSGGILALLVFVPVTAAFLMMGYTGFYDWADLQLMIPMTPVLALGACLAVEKLSALPWPVEKENVQGKKTRAGIPGVVAVFCVVFLLLATTNFHAFDGQEESDGYGIPAETLAVYESLREAMGEGEAVILADSALLQYVRLYDTDWYPAYGRDLWDSHAAGYVEYTYGTETEIYEILEESSLTEEDAKVLLSYVEETQPDCLIVPWYWETELEEPADYNLVTLTGQYIAYVSDTRN
ncbi:MAG: hypothetical protein LUG61_10640 [Lachnospiraceae bacterium]|nr:hypothetical protein [Lachnospiraceae bacterium]